MTAFQVIIIVLTALGLLGGIVAVHIRSQVEIAKIQTSMVFFQKDLDRKELAVCNLERTNAYDHKDIIIKIDKLIDHVKK